MDWEKILSKVATKGDLARVLLCGTAGAAVDIAFSLTGIISPGFSQRYPHPRALVSRTPFKCR
jgi:hypothetical protein